MRKIPLTFGALKIHLMDAVSYVHEQLAQNKDIPAFRAGDNVVVNYRIVEGDKVRIQQFRGDVLQIKGEGPSRTFTVRKVSNNVGVERIFPFNCPNVESVAVQRRGKVRRARLFYLRDRVGKKARIKEKTNY